MLPFAGLETQCKSIIEGRQEREGRGKNRGSDAGRDTQREVQGEGYWEILWFSYNTFISSCMWDLAEKVTPSQS